MGPKGEANPDSLKPPEEIEVPQTEGRPRQDVDRKLMLQERFKTTAGEPIFFLERLIGIGDRAQGDHSPPGPLELSPQHLRSIHLDVDELSPGLQVSGE